MISTAGRPEDFMSKKLFAFCLFSIGFTIFLLFGSPSPPSPEELNQGPAQDQQQPGTYRGRHAISTFLDSKSNGEKGANDDDDKYFVSARTLIYQLLHSPSTKLKDPVPVVVLVTRDVRESKRHRLREDGATVVEVEDVTHKIPIAAERWISMATKLHAFNPTIVPYEKVLYMDVDMVLTRPIDNIFQDFSTELGVINETDQSEPGMGPLPEHFIMAAAPETKQKDHAYPFLDSDHTVSTFNSGLFMYAPSVQIFQYYMTLLDHPELYYTGIPDQDMLNYAHRWSGPMPWKRLHWSWYINGPNDNDLQGNMALIHTKWWDQGTSFSTDAVEQFALARRWEMEGYWMGKKDKSKSW
ncbi:hypothetical protein N7462_006467 [Penicillium macrosclerotiorum]|uniref:uncharacterized protein n=1 Tax=Penicillium macrosclerotiorum TaxID=303699 RepID=UPI002546FA78|nr:uncharacterized protein N7462_006467 [Penicillium macrosclerotiorum]KAJ5683302.1 hypothetical protein N7462_006467 [Penicillium macrosclerotiorum]